MTEAAVAQDGQAEAAQSIQTEPQASIPEKIKVKIDGLEDEVDLESLKRDYQKYRGADKRFQEAAELSKKAKPYVDAIEKAKTAGDFNEILKHVDPQTFRKFAESWLWDKIQYDELPPEKKEAIEAKQRAEAAEAQLAERKKQDEERELETFKSQAAKEIDDEISEAIKGMGVRPTPRLIARVAETILASMVDETSPRMAAKDALPRTVADLESDLNEYLTNLPVDKLRGLLPKKTLDALRKAEVEQVMAQAPQKARQRAEREPVNPLKNQRSMSTDEFFNQLGRRLG